MVKAVLIFLITISSAAVGLAQSEADLKRYFEGQQVRMKIDMPATKDGVNIYPERAQSMDYSEYANRLKKHGTSLYRGNEIMITKIKVKDKHIEVQLGGGGYGTIGDETGDSVYVPSASKSRREKDLEDRLKDETDSDRRKRIKRDLDDLRRKREREDERNRAIAAEAREAKKARIEQKALQGGSRFNVHFSRMDSMVMSPTAVMDALRKYVDFEGSADDALSLRQTGGYVRQGVIHVGPRTTFLKEGLRTNEVFGLLGEPVAVSRRSQDGKVVAVYEFQRGEGRVVVAEFVSDALVSSRTETRLAGSAAGRRSEP